MSSRRTYTPPYSDLHVIVPSPTHTHLVRGGPPCPRHLHSLLPIGARLTLKKDRGTLEKAKHVIYVIDLQNDFVKDGEFGNKKATPEWLEAVVDELTLCSQTLEKDGEVLWVFSKDVHPEKHIGTRPAEDKGAGFPSHCDTEKGRRFPDSIKQLWEALTMRQTKAMEKLSESGSTTTYHKKNPSGKAILVTKGEQKEADSFSAVAYPPPTTTSSRCKALTKATALWETYCKGQGKHAFTRYTDHVGGAKVKSGGFVNTNMGTCSEGEHATRKACIADSNRTWTPIKKSFPDEDLIEKWKETKPTFYVVGLAGDYSVRDTALSLTCKFPGSVVVVPKNLTLYASPEGEVNTTRVYNAKYSAKIENPDTLHEYLGITA